MSTSEQPPGLLVWFDPYSEDVAIRPLTPDEILARVDKSVSVSTMDEDEATAVSNQTLVPDRDQLLLFT